MPFPGPDPPTISQTKLKKIIFWAMSITWQTNFLQVNDVSTSSVLMLQQFMSQECEFADQAQNSRGNNTSSKNNRHQKNNVLADSSVVLEAEIKSQVDVPI
jgi:hypothetical protein